MSPDDARHGTANGYNTHNRHGEKACEPCRQARAATRKDVRGPQRHPKLITSPSNYVDRGYDENDGLDGGRWMRDTWGVLRWVQIDEPAGHVDQPRPMACQDCGAVVSKKAIRCRPCSLEQVRLTNRRYMRYARAQEVA